MEKLEGFELRASEDTAKQDLELICTKCGEHLCDAQHGDELIVLAKVALSHIPHCKGERRG